MKQRDVWRLMGKLACGELGMIASNVRYSQQGSARFPARLRDVFPLDVQRRGSLRVAPSPKAACFHCNFPGDAGRVTRLKEDHHGT